MNKLENMSNYGTTGKFIQYLIDQYEYQLATFSIENPKSDDKVPEIKSEDVKRAFIIKAYHMIFIMVTAPTIFVVIAVCVPAVRTFMTNFISISYITYFWTIDRLLSLLCCHGNLKKFPINYIYLTVFTLVESYSVGMFTCFFEPITILYITLFTFAMSLSLILYGYFSERHLTKITYTLFWVSLGITIAGVIMISIGRNHYIVIICTWIILVIVALYIIVDVQLILKGQYEEISINDYIIGSMLPFVDFLSISANFLVGLCEKSERND